MTEKKPILTITHGDMVLNPTGLIQAHAMIELLIPKITEIVMIQGYGFRQGLCCHYDPAAKHSLTNAELAVSIFKSMTSLIDRKTEIHSFVSFEKNPKNYFKKGWTLIGSPNSDGQFMATHYETDTVVLIEKSQSSPGYNTYVNTNLSKAELFDLLNVTMFNQDAAIVCGAESHNIDHDEYLVFKDAPLATAYANSGFNYNQPKSGYVQDQMPVAICTADYGAMVTAPMLLSLAEAMGIRLVKDTDD